MPKLILVALLSAGFSGHACAEHLFAGIVIDSNGKGLAGLSVELAAGLGGLDAVFNDTALKTRTDKDGKFVLSPPWGKDVSFHAVAYSDEYFGEISEWNYRLRGRTSTEVCIVCGARYSASLKITPGAKSDLADRRGLVGIRSGKYSVRCHQVEIPDDAETLVFPVGTETIDVLCLAAPISKEIPRDGEMSTRGWMMRGEVRGAKCAGTINVKLQDFRADKDAAESLIRVRLPRFDGPFDLMGLDKSGVPLWHETPVRLWRVHCGGPEVEGLYDMKGQFVTVTISPGKEATHLMVWDRAEKRECLFDIGKLSFDDIAEVKWKPALQSRFTVELGNAGTSHLRTSQRGVTIQLTKGSFFAIQVVPSVEGKIQFDLPSNFDTVEVELTLGTGNEFREPRKVKVKRGVPAKHSIGDLAPYSLTVTGPSRQPMPFLIVTMRRVHDAELGEEFEIVLSESSTAVVYLEKGVRYEALVGGRWTPFLADTKESEIVLSPRSKD